MTAECPGIETCDKDERQDNVVQTYRCLPDTVGLRLQPYAGFCNTTYGLAAITHQLVEDRMMNTSMAASSARVNAIPAR